MVTTTVKTTTVTTTTTSRKRKPDTDSAAGSSTAASKKKRVADYTAAQSLVSQIFVDGGKLTLTAAQSLSLAEYVRHLEERVQESKPKEKSAAEIASAAEKLRAATVSGIKKQLQWKPSCKTGGAKWAYDGVCADPLVFGQMLGLGGPPTWKQKPIPAGEFQEAMGSISGSARYSHMWLQGNVNVRWKPDEGTFKMSGTYGV